MDTFFLRIKHQVDKISNIPNVTIINVYHIQLKEDKGKRAKSTLQNMERLKI